ncbi:glycosyl hydrolase [Dysgonomonas sp. 511]|uniref:glycosyl hydrolase n=1 Tax=Dysgonomonas sp. 511 TaxID=2302930 RepID=UPI0013D47BA9|nr:glycosyl hydrolase [Dysgonomonas sp. 511]NDV80179.1 glycosyl hydrolase [Dysgonomonas sp. 511]
MKKVLIFILLFFSLTSSFVQAQNTPAPLYRDPITDGAADPCLVYNPFEEAWWMLYTQRRANVETADVAFCYGNEIGIAYSEDNGKTWRYRGTLDLEFEKGKNTFWAPDIVLHNGVYHMFVSYIRGVGNHWAGAATMMHYTSKNLWDWKCEGPAKLPKEDIIDATLIKMPNGKWRMWYKWDSKSLFADSKDLFTWQGDTTPAVSDEPHEGAKAFRFKDTYWFITDEWGGMAVYQSDDLINWKKQEGRILDRPSKRTDDTPNGAHGDVVVTGDNAYIFYFTHPGRTSHMGGEPDKNGNIPYEQRRSSIQAAELDVVDGKLIVKDRDQPFSIYLPNN